MISIDWLQIYCLGTIPQYSPYNFIKQEFQTRHFKTIHNVFSGNECIASICSKPHAKILKENSLLIKFENKILYYKHLHNIVYKFLIDCDFKFINISRLDIAQDFNFFDNEMHPTALISGFLRNNYLKIGKAKFTVIGTQQEQNKYDYLRFGNNNSDISVYLYNKTKEFREVKFKSYIFECWKMNNININQDVWRLEVSIKGNDIKLIEKDTAEINKIDLDYIFVSDKLQKLYYELINKYFKFVIKDNQSNKSRMQQLKLFNELTNDFAFLKISEKQDLTRSTKIFINKLNKTAEELRSNNNHFAVNAELLRDEIANIYNLSDYLNYVKK
jgi:hypothetical protein